MKQRRTKPLGLCRCGHVGDGVKSQHDGAHFSDKASHITVTVEGHGPCRHCSCRKFTWVAFVKEPK